VQYAKTVHGSRRPSPGMVYSTYDFYLFIKYRYRIDIVSNSKKQYRCITGTNCAVNNDILGNTVITVLPRISLFTVCVHRTICSSDGVDGSMFIFWWYIIGNFRYALRQEGFLELFRCVISIFTRLLVAEDIFRYAWLNSQSKLLRMHIKVKYQYYSGYYVIITKYVMSRSA